MKILFVTRGDDFWDPLGLMQISSMAKKRGDESHLAVLYRQDLIKRIEEINPEVVAYGGCTGEHQTYVSENIKIKEKFGDKVFTIIGGPHATYFPEVLNEGNFDAICIGEGEYAFIELLDQLEEGGDISNIKNIIPKGGKLKGIRPLVQDLDELPFPDRDLFYENRADMSVKRIPTMNFISSRGCPYACTYCFNHAFKKMYNNQPYLRRRSVKTTIEELVEAKEKFGIRFVKFVDDLFVTNDNDPWFNEFCEKYPKEVGLPFLVYARFNLMTENMARMLSKAGCQAAFMSIESANERIRKEVLKRGKVTEEHIINGSKYCKDNGINIIAYSMLGLPTSKIEDDIAAIDLCIKVNIPVPEFQIFHPLPKTELTEYCMEKGYLRRDYFESGKIEAFANASVLNCFTEDEKSIQKNIHLLGPTIVRHPKLRSLFVNYLMQISPNKMYKIIYTLDKQFTYPNKIYNSNISLIEKMKIIYKGFKIEGIRRNKLSGE